MFESPFIRLEKALFGSAKRDEPETKTNDKEDLEKYINNVINQNGQTIPAIQHSQSDNHVLKNQHYINGAYEHYLNDEPIKDFCKF